MSLSGYVYLDANGDRQRNDNDWAIRGARVTLKNEDGSSSSIPVQTDKFGHYSFDALTPGVYDILLAPYIAAGSTTEMHGFGTGLVLASTELSDGSGTATDGGNSFRGIKVATGMTPVSYDFSKAEYPLELVSKKMLLLGSEPAERSPQPQATPEPATFTMLAIGCFGLMVVACVRRRKGQS